MPTFKLGKCSIAQKAPQDGSLLHLGYAASMTIDEDVEYAYAHTTSGTSKRISGYTGDLTLEVDAASGLKLSTDWYAGGGHADLILTELSTGDRYEARIVTSLIFHNASALIYPIDGVPQFAKPGGELSDIDLPFD